MAPRRKLPESSLVDPESDEAKARVAQQRAPDPLAQAVIIEHYKAEQAEAATVKTQATVWARIRAKTANVDVDISLAGTLLLFVAFWLLVGAILAVYHLPPPVDPYTVPAKLALLALTLGATGYALLRTAAKIQKPIPPNAPPS